MNIRRATAALFALFTLGTGDSPAQEVSLHGQLSGWLLSTPDVAWVSGTGLRYIPEATLNQKLPDELEAEADLSLNMLASGAFARRGHPDFAGSAKPYRAWARLASTAFELRVGLQRISFGSATLFRPLMWFDKIDPRDPLQLTDGVYALLGRVYFPNNANVWLWALYGNDDLKGWETAPTRKHSAEFGGRVQLPLPAGEAGFSYHHREADFAGLLSLPGLTASGWAGLPAGGLAGTTPGSAVPEDRFALDGKWDIGIGAWFEAAMVHAQTAVPGLKYQRQATLGADYTFDVGNGLTALGEHFRIDAPETPFGSAAGRDLSGLSLTYPVGLLDRVSGIVYRDWSAREWYRIVSWQRTYDTWSFYLLGFWNPRLIQLYRTQEGTTPFAGTGFQLMAVFNH